MKSAWFAVVAIFIASAAVADDWPQFRGPNRDGISKEKGLLKAWPKDGPNLLWTYQDAGLGHSSFSIVKGTLYTLGTDAKYQDEYVIALNIADGKELWRAKIAPLYTYEGNSYGDGPRATPTIDGAMLYALSGDGKLVCLDLTKKGAEVWRKDFVKDLGGEIMTKYGYSESPLIDGDMLICTPGGKQGTMAALDKKTGAVKWQSKGWTDKAPYSSPVVAEIHGVRQYLQLGFTSVPPTGSVAGIDTKGQVVWKKQIFTGDNDGVSTSPVVKGNQVYVTAGFGGGCHLFDIEKSNEATAKYKKTIQKKLKNTHGGVVLIDDHIYGHTEPGVWVCQELQTGEIKWDERDTLKCQSGAVMAADGMLYLYTDEGEVGLVPATPAGFNVTSSFKVPKRSTIPMNRTTSRQSRVWAHPVISDGVLYLRDHEYIFAFKIK